RLGCLDGPGRDQALAVVRWDVEAPSGSPAAELPAHPDPPTVGLGIGDLRRARVGEPAQMPDQPLQEEAKPLHLEPPVPGRRVVPLLALISWARRALSLSESRALGAPPVAWPARPAPDVL